MITIKYIKCVVWDLDDTLWDGTLIEGDSVTLKPGIREIIETLDSKGILLSIASKNNHEDAMEKLIELGLDDYFLYPKINWNAKSSSIEAIQKELNIGMDTLLFIDDQEFERSEVKSAHPEVVVLDAKNYQELIKMPQLNPKIVTEDSKRRRILYKEEKKRRVAEQEFVGAPDEFLRSLDMKFSISLAKDTDLERAEELTVRTNQLNSTGISYDYETLKQLMHSPNHHLWICELTDKFGSYGKIGLALVENNQDTWHIKLLLMSCRVVSRGSGTLLLTYILKEAKSRGKKVLADFRKTDRNRQMFITYKLANFVEKEQNGQQILFENDLSFIQEYPPYVEIFIESGEGVV